MSSPEQPLQLLRLLDEGDYWRALVSWRWLPVQDKRPFASSLLGDVFLDDEHGVVWFLDLLDGSLRPAFADRAAMRAALDTVDGQDEYLTGGTVLAAHHRLGLVPAHDEVLAWTVPPVLGGEPVAENLHVMGFRVWLHITGQLHEQLQALPPGTVISGFTLGEESAPGPP